MADKELRRMNRTELIEIIYAQQQNERQLREENEELHRQLDDKLLRLEKAGSIAEAALSLNHIFEDAEAAAQQYLISIQQFDSEASKIISDAKQQADDIVREAEKQAQETEEKCRLMRERTEKDIQRMQAVFIKDMKSTLEKYPGLAERMSDDAENRKTGE